MTSPNIEQLQSDIGRLIRAHMDACEEAASSAVRRAFASAQARPVKNSKEPAAPKKRKRASPSHRRSSQEVAEVAERLCEVVGAKPLTVSDLWLDLGLRYSEGQVLFITGRPKLLGPAGAIREFCTVNRQRYFRDPIRISDLAATIVELAAAAPEYRRGRR